MILVTGATGNIGSNVTRLLVEAGAPVRVLVQSPDKAKALGKSIEIVQGDYANPTSLAQSMKGVDKLFLLAPSSPMLPEQEGIVVDTAKRAGIEHIVKLSIGGAAQEAITFCKWHRASEKKLEASGLAWTFVRPNSFMTNLFLFLPTIKAEGKLYTSTGDGKVSFIDPHDIAAVAVKALVEPGHAGKAYDVTGPEALSYADVAAQLGDAIGRKLVHVDVPPEAAKAGMLQAGLPAFLADALVEFDGITRAGYAAAVSPLVQQVTGRAPRSFREWARANARAFA